MAALSVAAILYGYRVYDYFAARMFTPTAEVKGIHDSLKLTSWGSDIMYASKPTVQSGQAFNDACKSVDRTAAILGCYYRADIFLYNVTNPDLAGAKEVTAAHEMLHAAYQQLNFIDRAKVDKMINAEYDQVKEDAYIKKLMGYYKQAEPGELTNELHSILGTTLAGLSPELEQYYARYFTDRQLIVQLNQKYNSVFDSVEQRSNQLATAVNAAGPQIEADLTAYEADLTQLQADIETFNKRASSNYFTTNSAFQAARQALISRVNTLNVRRDAINARVKTYNDEIAELNSLSVRMSQLNNSINAAPAASGV